MKIEDILSKVDHTLLATAATWDDIRGACDDAAAFHTASVCIPPAFVRGAAAYLAGRTPVCTVIGFPNGYMTTRGKCFEAADAVENGADEIDMVIHVGALKAGDSAGVLDDIKAVKAACGGKVLKVIIETCLLTEAEKIEMCRVVTESGADFIKTSTGFSTGGATREDIALFASHVGPGVRIKAAGGIKSLEDAEDFIRLGAARLGTSSIVKLLKNLPAGSY